MLWDNKIDVSATNVLRLVFTSDGSRRRSRREPYALVKTARHKQKQKETFPFSSASASASVASEKQSLVSKQNLTAVILLKVLNIEAVLIILLICGDS